jgi:probable F420-dependent oxidoreductase
MRTFLDGLDAAPTPVPAAQRVLAALGPRMLELSRDRAAGAHPYMVTPEHTRRAREILGQDRLLAPEVKVILEPDPDRAYDIARGHVGFYLAAPNYANSLRRLGYTEDDMRDGGSPELVREFVAWGDMETIQNRVAAHFDAGADHVCVQVITEDRSDLPRQAWRDLAAALGLKGARS